MVTMKFKYVYIAQIIVVVLSGLTWPVFAETGNQNGGVARALFTTEIRDREPADRVLSLSNRQDIVYFFTDLRNMQGQTVLHKWYYEDDFVSATRFVVKGSRWRVYSKKKVEPQQIGKWKVVVYGSKNLPIKASVFYLVDGNSEQVILPYKN